MNEKDYNRKMQEFNNSIQIDEATLAENKAELEKLDFCSIWPTAKQILMILKKFLPFWLDLVVDAAILVGDRVHSKICTS